MVKCIVCEQEISYTGWAQHVEAHKRRFCKEYGIDLENYHKIPWETVVKQYNPKNAKNKKKQVQMIKKPQTTLNYYGGKNTCQLKNKA